MSTTTEVRFSLPDGVTGDLLPLTAATIGVVIAGTDTVVVTAGTAMLPVTGVPYTVYLTWPDPADNLAYTVTVNYTYLGETIPAVFTAYGGSGAVGTAGTKYWTRATLAEHEMGTVPGARNASGGLVPDRLDDLILGLFGRLWEMHPWEWRRKAVTLTTALNDQVIALPADYATSDQRVLSETSGNGVLELTTNVADFDDARQGRTTNGVTDTDQPRVAFCEVDATASEYRRQLRIIPAADGVYAYRMYYYSLAPALGKTDVPKWPPFMFRIWEALTQAIAEKTFSPNDDRWKSTYAYAKGLIEEAKQENDKDEETQAAEVRPGVDDWLAMQGLAL